MKYNWKINMLDGKSHNVVCEERDAVKFITDILPKGDKETISLFKCAGSYTEPRVLNKYDSVVIIGSQISSVEYFVGEYSNND